MLALNHSARDTFSAGKVISLWKWVRLAASVYSPKNPRNKTIATRSRMDALNKRFGLGALTHRSGFDTERLSQMLFTIEGRTSQWSVPTSTRPSLKARLRTGHSVAGDDFTALSTNRVQD